MKRGLGNLVRAGVDLAAAVGIALAAAGVVDGRAVVAAGAERAAVVETGAGNLAGKTWLLRSGW
jgi:hypothetical protein